MPAIDLQRLNLEIEEVRQSLTDADRTLPLILDTLDRYGERTKRPESISKEVLSAKSFRTMEPILRSLSRMLVEELERQPEAAAQHAHQLWNAGFRESRLLAVDLLECVGAKERREVIRTWVSEVRDPVVRQRLASQGLIHWRREDPGGFLDQTRGWLESGDPSLQIMAYLGLTSAAQDPDFHNLPEMYHTVSGRLTHRRARVQRTIQSLLVALVERNPAEAARFLHREVRKDPSSMVRLVRQLIPVFPEAFRTQLEQDLVGRQ